MSPAIKATARFYKYIFFIHYHTFHQFTFHVLRSLCWIGIIIYDHQIDSNCDSKPQILGEIHCTSHLLVCPLEQILEVLKSSDCTIELRSSIGKIDVLLGVVMVLCS